MEFLFSAWRRYTQWWQQQHSDAQFAWIAVGVATLLGSTYRFTLLPQTMQFLADQGRDALVAYGVLHGDVALVGPSTSVGSMFLGPLYYYWMAPFIALAGNSPLGPSVAVALLGVITLPVLYWVGKELVGRKAAVLATLLYASAPYVAEYTRFSWNPNPAPLVCLLMLWCTLKAWRGSPRWWLGVAFFFMIIVQLHYVALLALAGPAVFWLADVWRSARGGADAPPRARLRSLFLMAALGAGIVLLAQLPLVVFDWKFNHVLLKGFADFFNGDQHASPVPLGEKLWRFWREQEGRSMNILFELWGGKDWTSWYRPLNQSLLLGYVALGGWWLWYMRRQPKGDGRVLVALSTVLSVMGLAWYDGELLFHYFSYFYPLSYLVTASILVAMTQLVRPVGWIPALVLFAYIQWLAVLPSSLRYLRPLGWTMHDMRQVSERILAEIPADKTYSMTALTDVRDYRGLNYRYFLEVSDHPPLSLEQPGAADYLVIIAESPQDPTLVLGSPVYEVVVFPKGAYRTVQEPGWPVLYFISRQDATEPAPSSPKP